MPTKPEVARGTRSNLHQFGFRSMRSKFLATVVPMALGAIAIVFGVFEYISTRQAEIDLAKRMNSLLVVQSSALSGPIWTFNDSQVRLTVNALMSDPDIAVVTVFDYREAAGFRDLYSAKKPGMEASLVDEAGIYRETTTGQRLLIGKLVIGVSDERIVTEARQRLQLVASLAVVLLICMVFALLFSYRRIMETPLDRLLAGIQASKLGADAVAVEWTSSDEMGRVISAFNDMLEQRVAQESDLRQARDELEARVKARTAELAIAIRQLSEAIESTSEGFSLFDRDDRLIICNTKYKRLIKPNASAEEMERSFLPGTPFVEILRYATDSGIISVPPGQEDAWIQEQVRLRRSPLGRSTQLQISGQWIRIAERRTHDGSIVAVYTNVTELERARLDAEAASEAKSTFLATMSHEIRTPMNGVLGMLEVLERTPLGDDQRHMTETISKSATALLAIIDDILDFSKIEAGGIEIERTATRVREVCESAMMPISPVAGQKGLDLALMVEPDVATSIYTDPLRLRQILINLLGNAVKFTAVGSVVLGVRLEPGDDDCIRFTVTDTGVGIAKEKLSRIFTPFGQAESSTTRKYGGTGLGLTISQRLVETMKGSIGVDSGVGAGSSFWFTLPFEPVTEESLDALHDLDLSGAEALVVTGSSVVFDMIGTMLFERGVSARQAETPADAARRLREATPPDLVIVDGRMARKTFEALPELAGQEGEQRTQFGLLVCAGPSLGGRSNSVAGIHLDRPPTLHSLLRAVGLVLGRSGPGDEPNSDVDQHRARSGSATARAAPSVSGAMDADQLILIVDDHETNRDVIQRQLMAIGYASQVAANGEEALTMWRETPYALILTDCHMPVLDGFAMTAAIRSAEAASGRRTPIVALTANALLGEADLCLNAGMDDYLSKPVGIRKLKDTMIRWIGRPLERTASRTRPETRDSIDAIDTPDDGPLDLEVWENISGERDLSFLREVVGNLKPYLAETIEELRQFRQRESWKDIAETAHKGAGAAGVAAATQLSLSFKQLERAAREGRTGDIDALFDRLETEIERVVSWKPSPLLDEAPVPEPHDRG